MEAQRRRRRLDSQEPLQPVLMRLDGTWGTGVFREGGEGGAVIFGVGASDRRGVVRGQGAGHEVGGGAVDCCRGGCGEGVGRVESVVWGLRVSLLGVSIRGQRRAYHQKFDRVLDSGVY